VGYTSADPQPTTTTITGTTATSGTGASTTHTGTKSVQYQGQALSNGATAVNNLVSLGGIEADTGMILSYWIKPMDNALLASGVSMDASAYVSLDVKFDDGTFLSDLGVSAPAGPDTLQYNFWNQVSLQLPAAAKGKIMDQLVVKFGPTPNYLGSADSLTRIIYSTTNANNHLAAVTSSQNYNASESVTSIIDGSTSTKWLASHAVGEGPWWAVYELDSPQTVTHYVIDSANDATDRDPTDWQVQGSNDGTTWITLDERHNQVFQNQRRLEYDYTIPAANVGAYKFYRLYITDKASGNWEAGGMMQISEWQLYIDSGTASTTNGYAMGYIDDITVTRPILNAVYTPSSPVIEAGVAWSGELGSIANVYAKTASAVSATVDYGDGTSEASVTLTPDGSGGHQRAGSHTFAQPGTYHGYLYINDDGIRQKLEVSFLVTTPSWFYTPEVNAVNTGTPVESGGDAQLIGTGFKPGELVDITLNTTPAVTMQVMADASGRVVAVVSVPAGTVPGTYTATMVGKESLKPVSTSVSVSAPTVRQTPPSAGASKLAVKVTLDPTKYSLVVNRPITFKTTLSDATATGTVTVYDGAKAIKTGTLKNGAFSFQTRALAVGTHKIKSVYSGDGDHLAATSVVRTIKVVKAVPNRVAITAKKAKTTTTVTVTVGKLSNGKTPAGKVKLVNSKTGKAIKTVKLKSGKAVFKLPKSVTKVKATYVPSNTKTTSGKSASKKIR
jgi:hypothetical protein